MTQQNRHAGTLTALVLVGLLFGAFAPRSTQAQDTANNKLVPLVGHSLYNDKSPALGDMLAALPAQPDFSQITVQPRLSLPRASTPEGSGLLAQTQVYPSAMPSLLANFEGLSNSTGVLPPDTNGDIGYDPTTGKKFYFQTVNMSFRFWDVSDPTIPLPVTPPTANNTFWAGAGGLCETHNDGDPVALFDPLAHRWIFSQFALNMPNGPFYQCIAISETADPLGAWYRYSFQMPDADMNDYPKLAVWPDAYYMSDHQFHDGATWNGAGVFAFDRAKMLAGQPATYIYFNVKDIDINLGGHLPADFDGLNPPPVGAPGLFMELDHGIAADGDAYLMRIWEFHADFTNPANSTFGCTTSGDWGHANYKLVVDPFTYLTGYVVPQKDTGRMLDAIGDRLMYRLAYRNYGDRQVLMGSQTVDAGSGRAGIRWFEVQDSGTGWSIHQQGTYAPGDGSYRWMGSIAADALGNLALGFSISSSSMFPSINYTGRLANDPLGAMTQGEAVLVSGGGSQTFVTPRWGDYSAMSIDPQDDCTFWYTNEYYSVTSTAAWQTRIGAFRFSGCGLPATGTLSGIVTNASGGAPLAGVTVSAGTLSMVTGADGKYAFALLPGSYTVSAQIYGFVPGSPTEVVITVGEMTTHNFALISRSPASLLGLVSDGSGHAYPLYARLDISAPGFNAVVFSNPITGLYSTNLFQGQAYSLRVSSLGLAGYTTQNATVTPSAASVALNFNLQVGATCTTPGYQMVTGVCTPIPGGLASGFVTDANYPAIGLNGAYVSSGMGESTNTFATPLDPSVGDGMYVIFQPTTDNTNPEDHILGADLFPYSSVVYTVNYHPNGVVRQDFALPAGRISVTPAMLEVSLPPGGILTRNLRVTDTGTANAYFSLQTLPLASPGYGPFDPPAYAVKPFKQIYRTAESLHLPSAPEYPSFNAGAVLTTWSSSLASAWAVGTDTSGQVWVSSPSAGWSGDSALHAYSAAGIPTGQTLPYAWQPFYGPADLASNAHTGTFWTVGMGEADNCIYEMSPQAGFTGRRVCPGGGFGFPVAQRGLAYDPASDTFYSGSWNDLSIRQFRPDGTLLRTRSVGLAISGLAYNPDTHHLFAMVNAENTRIFVLDAANDFAPLGVFMVGADLLGAFSGAGLEMACDGSLWLTDQSDGQVYQVTSGEVTTLCQVQATWFSINPPNGYLAPGEYIDVQVTFDANGLPLGDYTGQLKVVENTPYDVPNLPITMHVQPGMDFYLPFIMSSH
jgi:hypothetical protein